MKKFGPARILKGLLLLVILSTFGLFPWTQNGHLVFAATAVTADPAKENGPLGLPAAAAAMAQGKMLADRDRNGLSDGLQARLAKMLPSDPVDVVATFSGPGNSDAAQHAVGPFRIKREFRIVNGFAATMTVAQARALAKAPGVFRVEEDFRVSTMLDASRSDFGVESVDELSLGIDGTGIGICIVDTGVDPHHEQLDAGKVAGFVDFVNGQPAAYDDHGHGTHVAAIAAGDGDPNNTFRGVAPGASIYSAKVLNSAGSGSDSDVIAGVEWCVDQPGVRIISLSLGSVGSSDGRDSLSQALNNAVASGKTTVVAAGNSGAGPATIGSPGAAEQAVTVGAAAEWSADVAAANHSDGVFVAWFSSRGPTADGRIKPDILSPGVTVTSAEAGTTNRYVTWSGTSMATPFVSGTVALALNRNGSLTPAQVKNMLRDTAQDWGPVGLDNDSGAGLLNGYKFVEAAGGMAPDPAAFAFPTQKNETGTVPAGSVKEFFFEIGEDDLHVPIAVTLTVASGGEICLYGLPLYCDLLGGWAWSPDYDAELIQVGTNTTVDTSICPLTGECGTMGRQETLHYMPTQTNDVGTYKVRVYQFPDDPGGIQDGTVSLDISTGPVAMAGGGTPNQPPVANAGADQSVTDSDGNGSESVTLNGSVSSDPDGTISSYVWKEGSNQIATGATPSVILAVGTHTITLTVTDNVGATATDTVVVTVNAAPNQPPVANAGADQSVTDSDGNGSESVTLNGSGSSDPDGTISSYVWKEGSTQIATGATPSVILAVGTHTITLTVTDNDGTPDTDTVVVTVNDSGPATDTMHIGDLDAEGLAIKSQWQSVVIITVHDAAHSPASGVTISGTWSGGYSGSGACTTTDGKCTVTSGKVKKKFGSMTFTVNGVSLGADTYIASDNHDPDGDSSGTSITVSKP